jgi:hypothetical protein
MRILALLVAVALLAPVAPGQKKDEVLVTFSGLLKSIDKKKIVIEPEPENQMTFIRSKRTRFLKGDRQIDAASITSGSVVSIQAFEKLNRELEAVTVTVTDAAPQSPSK